VQAVYDDKIKELTLKKEEMEDKIKSLETEKQSLEEN
jgi:hypothetical protein